MAKAKLTLAGWEFINEMAAKYFVNDGCDIDDTTLWETMCRLFELNLDSIDQRRLEIIWDKLNS